MNENIEVKEDNLNVCSNKEEVKLEEGTVLAEEVLEGEELKTEESQDVSKALEEEVKILKTNKAKLKDENKKLTNEIEALKDRLLRTASEYENFRKRTMKEKEGIYTDACEDVLKGVFPVLDNLERASSVEGSLEEIKKGIEMTLRQFKDSLTKLEVEEIDTASGFDPNFHNAVMHVEDESLPKNSVVEVFQKGYKKGNKVLRFSMVKVAN